jgi:hypothetical protein
MAIFALKKKRRIAQNWPKMLIFSTFDLRKDLRKFKHNKLKGKCLENTLALLGLRK